MRTCFQRRSAKDESLKVNFGHTDLTTFQVDRFKGWPGILSPLGTKVRRRVTHPDRGPIADLEHRARESALRLAAQLSMPPPAPACGSTKRWCPRRLLVDSGSGDHLASRGTTPSSILKLASKSENPLLLQTANGLIEADTEVPFWIASLSLEVKALLRENTPEVLSTGRLVEDHEFSFFWIHGHKPYFLGPDGRVIWLF